MDDSVIVLDDSVITVEDDVEDGELEDDIVWMQPEPETTTNKDNPPAADKSAEQDKIVGNPSYLASQENNQKENTLVFEVIFSKEERFAGLQKQVLDLLEITFAEKQLVLKINKEGVIRAYEKSEFQLEKSPSPALDTRDDFMIDIKPAAKLIASQVPSYNRSADVLDEQTEARKKLKAEAVNKCSRPKAQAACFNCGDTDHSIRECPKPRNNARIQRARKKKPERYHVDQEQRFGHIKPGKISTKTRHALGYARGELPFMNYRMRVLGYPPAWLEEAKVQSSGIALFNAEGTEVQKSDDEDGEADTFKYDINKIVEFPGFNVEPSGQYFDDYKHHNVPPFQPDNSKANFIKSLGENVTSGYRRKKLVDFPGARDESPVEQTSLGDCDMEIVDDAEDPPLPASLPPPPPPPPESTKEEEEGQARSPSPTLDDLKEQQEKLLLQLECNKSLNTTANDSSSLNPLDATAELDATDIPQSESAPATSRGTEASPAAKKFKASFEGTPVLKFSVFDKLPEGSNFKVGVSDVINFENLPDSTGKYEQMKGLLKNVREKMAELQSED